MVAIYACSFAEAAADEEPVQWVDAELDLPIIGALLLILLPRGWWREVLLLPLVADLVFHLLEPAFERLFEHNRQRRQKAREVNIGTET